MGDTSNGEAPVDVLVVGQTGIGKSSLINMIRGVPDNATEAAKVSNDSHPCTTQTTCYLISLGNLACQLWDTRGLGEAVEADDWWSKIKKKVRPPKHRHDGELEKELRERTRRAKPILMWCIDATKVDVPAHYEPFQRAFVHYCEGNAIPVIVFTRMLPAGEAEWKRKCDDQLRRLKLGEGFNAMDIRRLRVRMHKGASSEVYEEDAGALRNLISELM